jgi:phenylpyruvate tautomerase PptA (4-oxalocrotonate tautomerase family)
MVHLRRALAALLLVLFFVFTAACDADTVKQVVRDQYKIELSEETAQRVADHFNRPRPSTKVEVEELIRERWAGTGQADLAVRVARCESKLDPIAKNSRSTATGVYQLLAMHWRGKFDPRDPVSNVNYAYGLWKSSGWSPWNESRSCWS